MTRHLAQLSYGQPCPIARRNRRARRVVLALVLILLAMSAMKWGRAGWGWAMLLYHRFQCLHYAAPPGRIICVETEGASGQPPTLTRLDLEPAAASVLPAPGLGEPGSTEPLLFMHERRTKSGHRSLVVVRRTSPAIRASVDLPESYAIWVLNVDGWGGYLKPAIEVLPHPFDSGSPGTSLRFFAGQPDPADDSHFTIGYEANGRPGIIDGKLLDGHSPRDPDDRVELEDRGLVEAGTPRTS